MLLMGDEVRRSQRGNNNAYCQDNEISWFDWSLQEKNADIYRFTKRLIGLRLSLDVFKEGQGLSLTQLLRLARIQWHGIKVNEPDWGENSHSLAFMVRGRRELFYIILNAYREPLEFELPPIAGSANGGWRRLIDTYLEPPQDFCDWGESPLIQDSFYPAQARSVVLLVADLSKQVEG